ncbi:MAG: hypothetical protein ACJAQ4_002213 [Cryomorphaceae bacterium]
MLCSLISNAQDTSPSDTIPTQQEIAESTEEVDGLVAFAGYLGKKLYDGVTSQFEEDTPEEKSGIKRVRIRLGPIKIERIEKR